MATTVKRGEVNYTIPDAPSSGTESIANTLASLCDIIKLNLREVGGWDLIRNNPDNHTNRVKRLADSSGYESQLDNIRNSLSSSSNNVMTASDINNLINIENILLSRAGVNESSPTLKTGDTKNAAFIDKLCYLLVKFSDKANETNNEYYDDNTNLCKLSCQISCQQRCQLHCESCQYNTCHDQNCGGWS